ncbi:MAG: kelch repeat-containing protein, partial [Bacteroidota bacterium]
MKLSVLLLFAASIGVMVGVGEVSAQQSSWARRQDFASPARLQAVGFSIGGKGYIAAGTSGLADNLLQDLQEYDPGSNSWSFKSNLPLPLRGSAAFSIGRKAYITTGGGPYGLNYQLLEWDQVTNTWKSKGAFPPGKGRMAAVGVTMGNRGYIGTGYDLAERALNDFWEYDPFSNTWTQKAPLPGSGRAYAIAFAIHEKIYVGLGNNGSAYLRDWWEYTPSTNSWKKMEDLAGEARTGAMGFSVGGKGYIIGGVSYGFKPLRDVWEFDPIQNTWTQLDRFSGSGRGYGVSFVINDNGYIAAGSSAG